jgi:uncharacterized membrane protein
VRNKNLLFWICTISTIFAIGAQYYLTNHYYDLKYGNPEAGHSICSLNETINCNTTTLSSYSEFMGVPVSIFGALLNFALLILLFCSYFPIVSKQSQVKLNTPIKLLSLGLFLASLVMAFLSFFILKTVCPACSIAYVMSIIGVTTAWLYAGRGLKFDFFDIKILLATGIGVFVFAFFYHHNSLRKFGGKEIQEFAALQLEEWRNYPPKNIVLESPITLNATSQGKVKIIEFADFLCGHCAQAFPIIHAFVNSHSDVEFSFQSFALDGECNKAIERTSGIPCLLARISHCAGKQNKVWGTQKWIFANQQNLLTKEAIEERFKANSEELGLNYENLMSCADSDEVRKAITAQANLGSEIGITGTPSLFINGKKVPAGFNLPLLEKIYQEAN